MSLSRPWRHARRPGTALTVAALAVALVSFGGSAVAGGLVTGSQIKDGTLTSADLKTDRGIGGADVRDGTLSTNQMSTLPQGPQGEPGTAGIPGVDGLAGVNYLTDEFTVPAGDDAEHEVRCPTGIAVGGGVSSTSTALALVETRPLDLGAGWRVRVHNEDSSQATSAFAWAVCVSTP